MLLSDFQEDSREVGKEQKRRQNSPLLKDSGLFEQSYNGSDQSQVYREDKRGMNRRGQPMEEYNKNPFINQKQDPSFTRPSPKFIDRDAERRVPETEDLGRMKRDEQKRRNGDEHEMGQSEISKSALSYLTKNTSCSDNLQQMA